MTTKAKTLVLSAALAAACANDLPSPELVDNLRVVAVRAEPPEAEAGADVALDGLVLHPDAAEAVEQVWVACVVVAAGTSPVACADTGTVAMPPLCSTDPEAPLCAIGFDPTASYRLPGLALSGRAAGEPGQVVVTLITASTAGGGLFGCMGDFQETGIAPDYCRVAVKRVNVLPAGVPVGNANPAIASLTLEGDTLSVELAEGAAEPTPDGTPESLLLSWFVTGGDLERFRSEAAAVDGVENVWTAPTEAGTYRAAVVVRDGRGGEAWATVERIVP